MARVAASQVLLLILVIAAAASAGLIAVLRPLLARHALAQPNARSSHVAPTPQGGGIAVMAAAVAGVLAGAAISATPPAALWPLAVAVALLAVVGACDDIHHLPVAPRLLAQIVAVAIVVATLPSEARVVALLPWWIERAALLLAGVYAVNVANFMDGLDWMTVAEVVPVTAGLWVLSLIGALASPQAAVAVALLGAMLGFAPFNRPIAKLFLGDVGSLPIGLMLFWLAVQVALHGQLAAALLLPLYYLGDATITLALRLARRENVLRAHRTHFYQRATARGFAVIDVVTRVFLLNLTLAGLAIATVAMPGPWVAAAALALGIVLVAALLVHFARGRP